MRKHHFDPKDHPFDLEWYREKLDLPAAGSLSGIETGDESLAADEIALPSQTRAWPTASKS